MTEEQVAVAILLTIFALPLLFLFLWLRARKKLRSLSSEYKAATKELSQQRDQAERERDEVTARFASVLSIEEESAKAEKERDTLLESLAQTRSEYAEKRKVYDRLKSEVAIFDERISFAEMGVYEPHFDFDDSDKFKEAIRSVCDGQKKMVSDKTAVVCTTEWTVDGNRSKGKTMSNRHIRLTLRAFNNECDAAISNARWNNVNSMEKRIVRAREQIDKLNESNHVLIMDYYVELKLKELYLTHEYREQLKEEKDRRAEARRAEREEKKLLQEAEEARKEEERYQRLLEQARAEAAGTDGERLGEYSERIAELERELAAAHENTERAQAMAEKTSCGYVYVISNIGSFGREIVKIGLTRRLDPADRVRELGDASVPFLFDTHAIIYSENAPALEKALHEEFEPYRVNAANMRKEFFSVKPDAVEQAVARLAPDANFFSDIEAQEYFETLARREQMAKAAEQDEDALPAEI